LSLWSRAQIKKSPSGGWQESLTLLAKLVEAEIPDEQ
jgi:hypothetical protein